MNTSGTPVPTDAVVLVVAVELVVPVVVPVVGDTLLSLLLQATIVKHKAKVKPLNAVIVCNLFMARLMLMGFDSSPE
ncbi:hypothetical protein GCM10028774_54370 [Spirosoma jeollabukense]